MLFNSKCREQRNKAMNVTAIANHLNVAESAIIEVQEWARVLWVRIKGLGARFVSKKVSNRTIKVIEFDHPQSGKRVKFERHMVSGNVPTYCAYKQVKVIGCEPRWHCTKSITEESFNRFALGELKNAVIEYV
jgi:hypothetical protein